MKHRKAILIILGMIIAAFLMYLLVRPDIKTTDKERVSDISKQYEEYSRQIRDLKNQISQKEKEMQGEEIGWVILAFSADNSNLMNTIFHAVQEAGLRGTVVVSPEKLPGSDNCLLSLEDAGTLKSAGWDFALGGALEEDAEYETLFSNASDYLEQQGLGTPKAYFFDGGDYQKGKEKVFPVMDKQGISLGAAFGDETSSTLSSTELEDYPAIYMCQNVSMREGLETSKRMISLAYSEMKPLVLSDYSQKDSWKIEDKGAIEELQRILGVVKDMQTAQRIKTGTMTEYLQYRQNMSREDSDRQQEYEKFKKDCEDKIAELEMERRNLGTE